MIIDSFPFFQEIDLLKVRLQYLGDFVDKFIISESDVDFSGTPKNFVLDQSLIKELPFSDKIEIIQNSLGKPSDLFIYDLAKKFKWRYPLWMIQRRQRNSIQKKIKARSPSGIFMFGDLDEFPDLKILREKIKDPYFEKSNVYSLKQKPRVYDLRTKDGNGIWRGTVLCRNAYARKKTPDQLRKMRVQANTIECGWHFSYFGNESDVKKKISSISEVEKYYNLDPESVAVKKRLKMKINPFSNNQDIPKLIDLSEYPKDLLGCFKLHMPYAMQYISK